MTTEEMHFRLNEIKAVADDFEQAHMKEDALHRDVLRAVADGTLETIQEAQTLAGLALRTAELDFARWCCMK